MTPTLLWFRRDLRLQDHAALTAALARGGPVIAVFICDAQVET
ncbi:MAG: deoxyribodipyrimidine photo-lyase, partial [Planktomarina temperata]|nr:deoxyribodipyrimidine photo-lyase [Planktomarina temperata]